MAEEFKLYLKRGLKAAEEFDLYLKRNLTEYDMLIYSNMKRYRLLQDMDETALEDMDGMTLKELDVITIMQETTARK